MKLKFGILSLYHAKILITKIKNIRNLQHVILIRKIFRK